MKFSNRTVYEQVTFTSINLTAFQVLQSCLQQLNRNPLLHHQNRSNRHLAFDLIVICGIISLIPSLRQLWVELCYGSSTAGGVRYKRTSTRSGTLWSAYQITINLTNAQLGYKYKSAPVDHTFIDLHSCCSFGALSLSFPLHPTLHPAISSFHCLLYILSHKLPSAFPIPLHRRLQITCIYLSLLG